MKNLSEIINNINKIDIKEDILKYTNDIDKNIALIIIWPNHYNFINKLILECSNYNFDIEYTGNLTANDKYYENLLRQIHYGKIWWDRNIITETNKRINKNYNYNKLQFLIISSNNLHLKIKNFKTNIRRKYNIDKSYFHISDPDCMKHLGIQCGCIVNKDEFLYETINHIYMLKHNNTIEYLSNSNYMHGLNFNKYMHNYIKWLSSLEHNTSVNISNNIIKKNNFCVDNGGILAVYGIRDTHDLDFLFSNSPNEIIHINTNQKDIGCENINHRLEYERLGLSIHDIIHNPNNHFYHLGCKFMTLDILKKFKYNRTHTIGTGHKKIRQKDINDYQLILNKIS